MPPKIEFATYFYLHDSTVEMALIVAFFSYVKYCNSTGESNNFHDTVVKPYFVILFWLQKS